MNGARHTTANRASPDRGKPRVALVVHDFDPAYGQGRYCLELVRRLHGRFEFSVFANTCAAAAVSGHLDWQRVPAVRLNVLTTVATFLVTAGRAVRRAQPDLVHTQGLACWEADVITAHVCNGARLRRLKPGPWRARLFARLITPLERAFYRQRRARHLIAISGVVAQEVAAEYGWRRPTTVIHHGTDVERFRPPADPAERPALRAALNLPAEAWTWLFMGEAVKGLQAVIAQLPAFPAAQLLVVSRSDLAPFQAQAEALGVLPRVHLHGPSREPERLHRAADVFVYPSDYDTFALVASEAMATGLPVILGREIGAAELVQPGRNGLLCDPGRPSTLTAALRRLADDPALARQLGLAAQATIQQHTWDHCAAATAQVYEQVLTEKRAAAASR